MSARMAPIHKTHTYKFHKSAPLPGEGWVCRPHGPCPPAPGPRPPAPGPLCRLHGLRSSAPARAAGLAEGEDGGAGGAAKVMVLLLMLVTQ